MLALLLLSADLSFKDIRYLTRSLDDLAKGRPVVLAFLDASAKLAELNNLEKAHRAKVAFAVVNSGGDTIRQMAAHAVEQESEMAFLKDHDAKAAKKLGVERHGTFVLLDAKRKIAYRGGLKGLAAALEGKSSEAPPDGEAIKVVALPKPLKPPTFTEHVAPILHKHCVECHRPGTAAPFALATYEQARAKAGMIAETVRDGRMPPWYASPAHKGFTNSRELSESERTTLLQWVANGRLKGEGKLPAEPERAKDGWRIGKPDLVIQAPAHELPADGIVDYKYVVLPYVFWNTTWVQGVQILPDNPRVLHHCNMAWIKPGESFRMANFITGTVPGGEPMTLKDGTAYRIPAGSLLVLQIHYVTTGKKEKCRLSVGFKYAEGKVDRHLRFHYIVDTKFKIPAGAPAHRVAASRTLATDAELVGLFSHMHVRGRDMTFKAHTEGKSRTLLTIPNYNFDWQMPYRYAPGAVRLPKGTRLEAIAHYDNSAFNPFNPDPKKAVGEGQQTFHEMMNGFVFYIDPNEKLGLMIGKGGMAK